MNALDPMNKYSCTKCGRAIVTRADKDEIDLKCCSGDTPVKFKKVSRIVSVAGADLPKSPVVPAGTAAPTANPVKTPAGK